MGPVVRRRLRYQRVIQEGAERRDSWAIAASAAVPLADPGRSALSDMTTQNGRAFNEWLRAQLKAKKMSQRQLAQQSGVDHSTISRLIRGDRMPSLGTATKLARGLRELRDDADTPQYLGLVASGSMNPTARVEYALRADDLLTEPQVRQIMEYYLAVRMRRYGRPVPDRRAHRHDVTAPRGAPARPSGRAGRARWATTGRVRSGSGSGPCGPSPRTTRAGSPAATEHSPGHGPDRPPRPGLGDSERRRLGRRRSPFPAIAAGPPRVHPRSGAGQCTL